MSFCRTISLAQSNFYRFVFLSVVLFSNVFPLICLWFVDLCICSCKLISLGLVLLCTCCGSISLGSLKGCLMSQSNYWHSGCHPLGGFCKHIRSAVIGLAHALCKDTWQARRGAIIVLVLRNSGCTTVYNKSKLTVTEAHTITLQDILATDVAVHFESKLRQLKLHTYQSINPAKVREKPPKPAMRNEWKGSPTWSQSNKRRRSKRSYR